MGSDGAIRYVEDPGINGQVDVRDDGTRVAKFNAPKAMLMSFIIDGIMSQRLPWALVLIGVFVSAVLELCGLSSLAFAVGVYLPLSTSAPIMMGGLVRWLAARTGRAGPSEEAAAAESGPGVLFSSGLIAGASVAGMAVAMMQLTEPTRVVLAAARLGGLVPGLAGSDLAAFLPSSGCPGALAGGDRAAPRASHRLLRAATLVPAIPAIGFGRDVSGSRSPAPAARHRPRGTPLVRSDGICKGKGRISLRKLTWYSIGR